MTDNILQFPSDAVQNWVIIEREIRGFIKRTYGEHDDIMNENALDNICKNMKERYDNYFSGFNISIPLPGYFTDEERELIVTGVQTSFVKFQTKLMEVFLQDCLALCIRLEIDQWHDQLGDI